MTSHELTAQIQMLEACLNQVPPESQLERESFQRQITARREELVEQQGREEKVSNSGSSNAVSSSSANIPITFGWELPNLSSEYWNKVENWNKLSMTNNWPLVFQRQFFQAKLQKLKEGPISAGELEAWETLASRFTLLST